MKTFSIKELEKISTIKAPAIRMWEKRFRVFTPERTATNIRVYTLSDLKNLLDIVLLLQSGHSISHVCLMDKAAIETELQLLNSAVLKQQKLLHTMIFHMYKMNVEEFEGLLDEAINQWDIDTAITGLIIPFLERTAITSYTDNSIEVHFAVAALRKKLILGIESIKAHSIGNKVLLFLPEGEHYDLILLYMTYLLRKKGINTLYLGTNISIQNLHRVVMAKKPHMLFTYIADQHKARLSGILHYASASLPGKKLYVVGNKEKRTSGDILKQLSFVHYTNFADIF